MPPRTLRSAGLAAVFSGASLIAAEATLLLVADTDHWDCNSGSDVWVNALYLASFVLIAPAVLGIHRAQSARARKWGGIAATLAAVGAVLTGVVNAAEHCLHLPIGLLFVLGALVTVTALAAFGVSVVRAGVFPSWIGIAILVGSATMQLTSQQGGIYAFGAAWIAVGVWLLVRAGGAPLP